MTRDQPIRTTATLHIDHRMVRCDVRQCRHGYFFIWPVADAGPSTRGLNGDRIRRRWEKTQWVELSEKAFEERLEESS